MYTRRRFNILFYKNILPTKCTLIDFYIVEKTFPVSHTTRVYQSKKKYNYNI